MQDDAGGVDYVTERIAQRLAKLGFHGTRKTGECKLQRVLVQQS
jgi:hypothetical protein